METETNPNTKKEFFSSAYWLGQPASVNEAHAQTREGAIVIVLYVAYFFFRSYMTDVFGLIPIDIIGITILAGVLFFVKQSMAQFVSSVFFFMYAVFILVYALYVNLNIGTIGVSLLLTYVANRTLRAGIFLYKHNNTSNTPL